MPEAVRLARLNWVDYSFRPQGCTVASTFAVASEVCYLPLHLQQTRVGLTPQLWLIIQLEESFIVYGPGR